MERSGLHEPSTGREFVTLRFSSLSCCSNHCVESFESFVQFRSLVLSRVSNQTSSAITRKNIILAQCAGRASFNVFSLECATSPYNEKGINVCQRGHCNWTETLSFFVVFRSPSIEAFCHSATVCHCKPVRSIAVHALCNGQIISRANHFKGNGTNSIVCNCETEQALIQSIKRYHLAIVHFCGGGNGNKCHGTFLPMRLPLVSISAHQAWPSGRWREYDMPIAMTPGAQSNKKWLNKGLICIDAIDTMHHYQSNCIMLNCWSAKGRLANRKSHGGGRRAQRVRERARVREIRQGHHRLHAF